MDDEEETLAEELCRDWSNVQVFDRLNNHEQVPGSFTAATVRLDATAKSSLNWKDEYGAANDLVQSGRKIVFELDLGLFSPQSKALNHQGQYSSTSLALNEFCKELWHPFQEHTLGAILYRADAPFQSTFERDEKMDYLDLLRSELPDSLPCLLLFGCKAMSPFDFVRFFATDRFSLFTLALAHAPVFARHIIWQEGQGLLGYIGQNVPPKPPQAPTLGLLLPCYENIQEDLRPLVDKLIAEKTPFRLISEDFLATEWEGLDELIVPINKVKKSSLRLVDGFKAAGGTSLEVHL